MDKKLFSDVIYENEDLVIEFDKDNQLIRIFKDDKCIKWWLDQDTVQTSFLPDTCNIINEFNNVFKLKNYDRD